jgi:hypothetical protein
MGNAAVRTSSCHARLSVARVEVPPWEVAHSGATLVPRPPDPFAERMRAKGAPPPAWFELAPAARLRLERAFGRFRIDLSRLTFGTAGAFGQIGITFGDTILLSPDFPTRPVAVQLGRLAHEIAHSIQYRRLGWVCFLSRYVREWRASGGNPYLNVGETRGKELMKIPIAEVDPISPKFYLDELADRFRQAVEFGH